MNVIIWKRKGNLLPGSLHLQAPQYTHQIPLWRHPAIFGLHFHLHFVLIVRIFQSKIKRFTRFLRVANYFIVFRGRDVFPNVQLRFSTSTA